MSVGNIVWSLIITLGFVGQALAQSQNDQQIRVPVVVLFEGILDRAVASRTSPGLTSNINEEQAAEVCLNLIQSSQFVPQGRSLCDLKLSVEFSKVKSFHTREDQAQFNKLNLKNQKSMDLLLELIEIESWGSRQNRQPNTPRQVIEVQFSHFLKRAKKIATLDRNGSKRYQVTLENSAEPIYLVRRRGDKFVSIEDFLRSDQVTKADRRIFYQAKSRTDSVPGAIQRSPASGFNN